jgi:hypothetical protein
MRCSRNYLQAKSQEQSSTLRDNLCRSMMRWSIMWLNSLRIAVDAWTAMFSAVLKTTHTRRPNENDGVNC